MINHFGFVIVEYVNNLECVKSGIKNKNLLTIPYFKITVNTI